MRNLEHISRRDAKARREDKVSVREVSPARSVPEWQLFLMSRTQIGQKRSKLQRNFKQQALN